MFFLALLPGMLAVRCCDKASGLGGEGQYDDALLPPPHHARCAWEEGRRIHTAAVVTPPSTTMVWPVMKLEASEAR